MKRQAIASLYHCKIQSNPNQPLRGRGGILAELVKTVDANRRTVESVVMKCNELDMINKNTDTVPKPFNPASTYERPSERKIAPNSFKEHLLSIYKSRHSIPTTTDLLNSLERLDLEDSYDPHKHHIGTTAVKNALNRMNFEKQKVKKTTQQTNNPIWTKARYHLFQFAPLYLSGCVVGRNSYSSKDW